MTMSEPHVLVTGATGNTGSRVVAGLAALGRPVSAASRRATDGVGGGGEGGGGGVRGVRFDWYDAATYREALRGVDRAYLVPPVGDPDPGAVMLPFLARARDAGVQRAVLLSSSAIPAGGPGVGRVHEQIADLFDQWAVLRPSWFMQNFTGHHLHAASIRDDGAILSAAGTGRVGFIDADDIAAVAVRALTDETAPCTDLLLTGPEALSYDDVAGIIAEVTGRAVRHRSLSAEQLTDRLVGAGIPERFAAMLADMDQAIAKGAEDRVTDTVARVTGRPPRGFREHAEEAWR